MIPRPIFANHIMELNLTNSSNFIDENDTQSHWVYGGGIFQKFSSAYDPIHLPLSLIICLLGIVANTLNVIVLTRRSMATPTNVLLTGLSAAQLFLLMNYLLLLTFNVCASSCLIPALHSYSAVIYKWINVNLNVAFHTTALIHTLVLAIFRFLAVQAPTFARTKLTISTARVCVISLLIIVPILCVPTFFTSHVDRQPTPICYVEEEYDLLYNNSPKLLEAAMWVFGIFFKLVPGLTISVLSLYLIVSLRRYQEKKARLTGKLAQEFEKHEYKPLLMPALGAMINPRPSVVQELTLQEAGTGTNGNDSGITDSKDTGSPLTARLLAMSKSKTNNKKKAANSKQRHGLTKMLVAVALLCASVEVPHGILNLLTAVFGNKFGEDVYNHLGEFLEMLTLLYSSVNFVLYCIMSTEFQRTFKLLFLHPMREAVGKRASSLHAMKLEKFTHSDMQ